jgi:protoheme IX farnesyltransferase
VGSVPGALPPVAGYLAVTNNFDLGALLLFLIMAVWQMPHFYSIAVFRLKDYAAARLPVLPVKKSVKLTKIYILFYIAIFLTVAPLLTILGYAGYTYMLAMGIVGLMWFWKGIDSFASGDSERWARKMFGFSLIVLLVFSMTLSLDAWLP